MVATARDLLQKYIFIFLLSAALASCAPAPRFTSGNNPKISDPEKQDEPELRQYNNLPPVESFTGLASFYAHKFHGRLTSNGETYNMYNLTAAHNSWPMNTIIKVTNLANGESVIIRINDHMPLHPERIIDLSLGTAQKLDMVETGVQEVRLDILKWGDERGE